jgi:hypothetical protein
VSDSGHGGFRWRKSLAAEALRLIYVGFKQGRSARSMALEFGVSHTWLNYNRELIIETVEPRPKPKARRAARPLGIR